MSFFKKFKYRKIILEAEELKDKGDIEGALKKYYEAFEIIVNVHDYFTVACILVDLQRYDKALKIFQDIYDNCALTNNLQYISDIYFGLGVCYDSLKQEALAIENYEKAIETGTIISDCFYFIASIYDNMKLEENDPLTQKAFKYYEKAKELCPDYLFVYVSLGNLYSRFNHDEEALKYFLKAKELDKDNFANSNYNLGVSYSIFNDFEKAEYYYLEELKCENPYYETYNNLGILYKDEKKYDLAKQYYLKALELNKEDYNTWYNLGCLYALMNDFDNAFECFVYIKYNKNDYLSTMEDDSELVELRKDKRYQELLEKIS